MSIRKAFSFDSIFEYLFVLLATLNFSIYGSFNIVKLIWQICLVLMAYFSYSRANNEIKPRLLQVIFIIFIYCIIFMVINFIRGPVPEATFVYITIDPILLIICFCGSGSCKPNTSIFIKLENVILIISAVSLIGWILFSIGISPNSYININWGGNNINPTKTIPGFFYLDFAAQGKSLFLGNLSLFRNTGIFLEAPIYSCLLCFALLIELYIKNANKIFNVRTIFLLLTILSTNSTTGIIVSILLLIIKELFDGHNNLIKILIIVSIPILIFLIKFIISLKTNGSYDLNSSYSIRNDDIYSCFKAWQNHFLIGNGLNNIESVHKYMYIQRLLPDGNGGLSSGFMWILASGGLLYGVFYLIPSILVLKISRNAFIISITCFILIMLNMIFNSTLYVMFIAYLWSLIIFYKNKS